MARRLGMTLVEVMVLLCVAVVATAVVSTHATTSRSVAWRAACASNLRTIYKAAFTYSTTYNDVFPVAGAATPGGEAIGFREGNRETGLGAAWDDNVTAGLWMLVRDGSLGTRQYVCQSTADSRDELTVSRGNPAPALLDNTRDFLSRENLSYSVVNFYHPAGAARWHADVAPDDVLMGDNNANDHPDRHRSTNAAPAADASVTENSPNHGYEGQVLLYGDARVSFEADPYAGPGGDNVYAMTVGGKPEPPSLSHDAGDAATDPASADTDVSLLPISGNAAVSLSGLPLDVVSRGEITERARERSLTMVAVAGAFVVIVVLLFVLVRKRPGAEASD